MKMKMRELLQSMRKTTDYFIVKKIFDLEPKLPVVIGIQALADAVMPFVSVILLKEIIDALAGRQPVSRLGLYLGILLGAGAAAVLVKRWIGGRVLQRNLSFSDRLERYLTTLSVDGRYDLSDSDEYLKMMDRAYRPIKNQGALTGYMNSAAALIKSTVMILSMTAIIASSNVVLVALIVALAAVLRILQKRKLKVELKYEEELTVIDRRYEYYDKLICDMSFGKEVRLYGMYDYIMGKIRTDNQKTLGHTFALLYNGYGKVDGVCRAVKYLEQVLICGLLVVPAMKGWISIGTYSAAVAASISLSAALNEIIDHYFQNRKYAGYLTGLRDYCQYVESGLSGEKQGAADFSLPIELKNVSFHYPANETWALKGISLSLQKGKKYAIVGENGAGKTTLLNLILGLYLPASGMITANGIEIQGTDVIRRACVPMYQKTNLFPCSLRDNILLGRYYAEDKMREVISWSGMDAVVAGDVRGMDALLCRDIDEHARDLSGGERQKLGIARTIYESHDVLILDEPTSAMDSVTEMHVYADLDQVAKDRCVLIVSHRMSCCRFCDEVIVMRNGRIAGQGTHAQLLQSNDAYKRLWHAQAARYA